MPLFTPVIKVTGFILIRLEDVVLMLRPLRRVIQLPCLADKVLRRYRLYPQTFLQNSQSNVSLTFSGGQHRETGSVVVKQFGEVRSLSNYFFDDTSTFMLQIGKLYEWLVLATDFIGCLFICYH